MKRNIALIGLGYWGKNHLRNLYELGVLHSAFDVDPELIEIRKRAFPQVNYVTDENSIIENPQIEGVVIAVPAAKHYEVAKKYLIAGKDVLVEKPLALNTSDAADLVDTANSYKRILMVGHLLQYHPAVIRLKKMIDEGDLGDIRYIYSNRLNIGKIRTEENVLWSFAPHDISIILMLLNNKLPEKINAFGGSYISENVYDTVLTVLEFDNSVIAHIFVSWLHPFKEQKLVVVGTKNMVVFDDMIENKLVQYPHKIEFENGKIPVAKRADSFTIELENKEPLKEELLHFINCIEKRTPPKTNGEEGLRVLEILEKAEKGLRWSK